MFLLFSALLLLGVQVLPSYEVGFGKVVRTLKEEEGLLDLYNRVGTTNTRRVGGRGRKRGGWASQARRGQSEVQRMQHGVPF